jgi:hypothetical protein
VVVALGGWPPDAAFTNSHEEDRAMIEHIPSGSDSILAFKPSGKLQDIDYKHFTPVIESAVRAVGKIRVFAQFHDFHGWDLNALWDDTKFATQHCGDIERIALVGEQTWEKWMAKVCKPFTRSTIRYFDAGKIDDAWAWLRGT